MDQVQQQFNLVPSPRVLRMLGQIDFKPWQCIAELVDNAVDAFISERTEAPGERTDRLFPQVNIELSSAADIRAGHGELRVIDNGPGMSPAFLENAVRAGYSSNDSTDKLGLFGMGFNVATARLGHSTEVWTTRSVDDFWSGVRIDFDEMERSNSFAVPALRRRKSPSEERRHGTEVLVTKLERERALYLRSGGGLKSTRDKLSRVYNKIIRDIGLQVVLVGTPLQAREFCVWDKNRFVETKGDFGRVPAYLDVSEDLGIRNYCEDCWVWLQPNEDVCPVCKSAYRLTPRERKVTGWIGIQRYFNQSDYGIDLIRNGRVIEERSKVFFSWTNPDTDEAVQEYPLEQTHWGGRIVGELNIDFVPLASHQKDAFDKTSREWRLVEEAVRGQGPIVQKYRVSVGLLDRNMSPLARMHAAYRRGQPAGLRWLVPGDEKGRGFNRPAEQWAALFWAGDPDYQADSKWYKAVLTAEEFNSKKRGQIVPPDLTGEGAFPGEDEGAEGEEEHEPEGPGSLPQPTVIQREDDPSLSGTYELREVAGSPQLEVTTERLLTGRLPTNGPIEFAAVASRIHFTYDPRHPAFAESLLEPVDCLVEEIAYQLLARSSTNQNEFPVSQVVARLREKYFHWTVTKYDQIRDEAAAFLDEMLEFFTEALSPLAPLPPDVVSPEDRKLIAQAVQRIDHGGDERVREVLANGEYPKYLGARCLPALVTRWPELILDGQYLTPSYADVDLALRGDVLRQVNTPLNDLIWVANPDGAQAGGPEWRNLLGRAANSLRLLQAWKTP